MKSNQLPLLYVKTGCPYCIDAVKFLGEHGVSFREINVTNDSTAFAEMEKKSKQTKAPTLDWNGKILADFGIEELVPFLQSQGVKLEDS